MSEGDAPNLTFVFREGSGLADAARRLAEMTPEEVAEWAQMTRDFTSPGYPSNAPVDIEAYRAAWRKMSDEIDAAKASHATDLL